MTSSSKPGKDNKASYKTELNWEEDFVTKFDCDFHGKDVIRIRFSVCGKWEKRINSIKNFSYAFIRPGTVSLKKDAIKIHCLSEPHKVTTNLEQKSKMGAQPYLESVIQDTPIGKAIKKCVAKIKMRVEFCLTLLTIWQNKNDHFLTFLICLNYRRKIKCLE